MPSTSELYDVIIIGGSYSGLAAALTLYRATHTCIIFDSGAQRNIRAGQVRLTSGWEGRDPQTLRTASRTELRKSGLVEFVDRRVDLAKKNLNGVFEVVDSGGSTWTGRKILLAIGAEEIYPDIDGYADNYASSIFHCMFCFGYELRSASTAGVLATGILSHANHVITNACDARKFVDTVIIYTDGNTLLADELSTKLQPGMQVDNRKLRQIQKDHDDRPGVSLAFDVGDMQSLAFLVHKPELRVATDLVVQLGCEYVPGSGIKVVPPFNSTNVEGVYAAGDCASPLRNIPNAMSMGSFVGCGIARELPPQGNTRNARR